MKVPKGWVQFPIPLEKESKEWLRSQKKKTGVPMAEQVRRLIIKARDGTKKGE